VYKIGRKVNTKYNKNKKKADMK